ncbi:MAG TPA: hypothetical protein VFB01_13910 [Burkholderiales bacterium]|nr:hypothetical protein [Burkholderiales bacterium]
MDAFHSRALALAAAFSLACASDAALGHGFAGKRFFPATLASDDPFVADELSLPTVSSAKSRGEGDEPGLKTTTTSVDYTKRVTPDFGVGLGAAWLRLKPDEGGGDAVSGADNLSASAKYRFYQDEAAESIASFGVDWDIGHSGAKRVGPEAFSTFTPTLFAGKGFGELPESLKYLRPVAVTGTLGVGIPSRSSTTTTTVDPDTGDAITTTERHPHVLKVGFSLQYSLSYLQSFVKDVGLPAPLDRMIPLIEVSLQKPLDRGGGPTTGTWNPGILWAGRHMQLGVEAILPINSSTPVRHGWIAQIHFFMDDLFPRSLGRPISGTAQ